MSNPVSSSSGDNQKSAPASLPPFANDEEAGDFVDANSLAPYLDAMEEVTDQVAVRLQAQRRASHDEVLRRLPKQVRQELAQAARRAGLSEADFAARLIARSLT